MRLFHHPLWHRFTTIARPFFTSEARSKAIGGFILLAVLLLAVNGLNFLNSFFMRDFMTSLEQKHPHHFFWFGLAVAGVFGLATIGEAFQYYTEQRTALLWREWLTHRLLDRYLAHRAYHRLTVNQSIDNPDERISEDVKTFTTSSLSFIVQILNSLLALSLFFGVLWSITPWLVLTAVLYALGGTLGTILLGRRLVSLNNQQLQKEADFRFALVRVRQRGESGEHHEDHDGRDGGRNGLRDRFKALVENFRSIISVTRNVGFFTREYNYLIQIIPVVVVAPLYFSGAREFGIVAQATMAFGQVMGAFSLIVSKYQELSTFAAVVNRLGAMWEATESGRAPAEEKEKREQEGEKKEEEKETPPHIERKTDDHRIAYDKLTLWMPQDHRVLLRDLSLELPEGKRLLVSGASGSGKTALGLATAGLWGRGQGQITAPRLGDLMILPQRLYTATGRLRDLLLSGLNRDERDDEQLRAALRDTGLGRFADEAGGLDTQWDWYYDLTTGDRHALALARLLLARPRFAVLDGLPWGLPPERLKHFYEALARSPITYISLGGPADLQSYHDLWLELQEEGKWRLRSTHEGEGEGTDEKGGEPPQEKPEAANEPMLVSGEKEQPDQKAPQ